MRFGMVPRPVGIWPAVVPLLGPTVAGTDETLEDVMAEVDEGLAQLWIAHEGEEVLMALVTRLHEGARGKTCDMAFVGGRRLKEWAHVIGIVEQAAREEGCNRITFEGRAGWQRVFPDYRQTSVRLEKEL